MKNFGKVREGREVKNMIFLLYFLSKLMSKNLNDVKVWKVDILL